MQRLQSTLTERGDEALLEQLAPLGDANMSDRTFTVRRATEEDAAALVHLAEATFTETFGHLYPPEDLAAYVASAYGYCKLPVEGLEPGAGELRQLYVRSAYQNHGVGARLFDAALGWLESHYSPLYIGVWSANHGAQRFYGRYGFVKVGEYGFPVGQTVDREFILRR